MLDWHISIHPSQPHVHLYGECETAEDITYSDLGEGARAVAAGLVARGVEPGAHLPIVLLGIRGTRSILRDGSWFARGRAAAVTIGTPIAPAGDDWPAAVALRDRVRTEISALSGEAERVAF